MRIFWKMTLTEVRLNLRNIVFLIFTLIMPLALVMLFGGLYGNDLTPKNIQLFGMGAVSSSTPAYAALALGIIAIIGMPQQIVGYKENKVFKRLKATPIKKYQILFPILLNYLMLFIIGAMMLFLYAFLVYDVRIQGNFFAFLFSVALSFAAMFSLGFLLSCLCKNVKQIMAIGFAFLIPMLFLSGATMPLGAFPDVMGKISKAMPLTYAVDFMKNTFNALNSFGDNWLNIVVLSAITIVSAGLSFVFFKWE